MLAAWKSLGPGNEAKDIPISIDSWQNVNITMSGTCIYVGIMNGTCSLYVGIMNGTCSVYVGIMNGTCICLCRYHTWYMYFFYVGSMPFLHCIVSGAGYSQSTIYHCH